MLATASCTPALEERLAAETVTLSCVATGSPGSSDDALQTAALARTLGATWAVLDGYHFGDAYQEILKEAGLSLLCVDDYGHARHSLADAILNQNSYATPSLYPSCGSHTQMLLGTDYVLLRREFLEWRGWQRPTAGDVRRLLVSLGGADPDNVTLKVVEALSLVDMVGLQATVIVGGSNPHKARLRSAVRQASTSIQLLENVSKMPELMASADLAICAGGSTCWELAFLGLPSLTLVLADNQRWIASDLDRRGVTLALGWHGDIGGSQIAGALKGLMHDGKLRAEMSSRGRSMVDGAGAARVVQILRTVVGASDAHPVSGK